MKKSATHRAVMIGAYVLLAIPAIVFNTFLSFCTGVKTYIDVCIDDWNE